MVWRFNPGNLYFIIELLAAELIFLYPVPRRRGFWFRFVPAVALTLLFAAFFPRIDGITIRQLYQFIRFFSLFLVSIAAMGVSFDLKADMLCSMCVAGYAVQHCAYRIAWLVSKIPALSGLPSGFLPADRLFELTVMPLVYLVFFLTMGRYAAKHECYRNSDVRFHAVSAVTILICIGLTRLYGVFGEQRSITGSIYSIVCCLLALYIQFFLHRLKTAERETAAIEFVRREEKKQYALSKNAMDSINIKLHDLRHRLAGYEASVPREALESLSEDINIYESAIKTGNDALDVLLMEKSLSCRMKGITLTFSGNCASLSFMKTMDLYSLFGNAIDNAIEAAEGLEEEKRVVGVSVEERGDLIFATFTNYFDGTLRMADGLPETTKTDHPGYHGYGMKSMKLIAEKYAGGLSVTAKGDVFRLSVYLCRDRAA